MTVSQLKALLADAPDNAEILTPTEDHTYRKATLVLGTARLKGRTWSEDFGEEQTPTREYGPSQVVIICE